MKITTAVTLIFITFFQISLSQERKFGDVTISELETTKDDFFEDASAVILYRNINFEYGKALEVHERIKIYNSEGFEHSNWTISFDGIRGLKAATYNLENGKIKVTKVTKDGIFKEEVSEDTEISKLTFPNIKEGSIIELKYRVTFIGFSTLYTQMGIPIKYEHISVSNGYYGNLSVRQNQYVELPIKRVKSAQTDIFIGENVPGLKKEKFVGNIDNHRGSIHMERHSVAYQQTWTNVAKKYYNIEWFGAQLRNGDALYKKDLELLLAGETDTLKMVKKIERFVKNKVEWDKTYSRGSNYVKTVYRENKGDTGDINMLLIHMLKAAGIRANPIAVATKRKGWVKYPNFNAFNTVLCVVDVDKTRYILDASQRKAGFGQLPLRYINGVGLLVDTDTGEFALQEVEIQKPSKNTLLVTAAIAEDQISMKGTVKKQITNYYALNHREYYSDLGVETYEEALNNKDLLSVENVVKKDVENPEKPIAISYNFTYNDYIEEIGDNLYFEPLLFLGVEENIFNEEDRLYPIDLEHPYAENYIITFDIPEGYQIESVPDPRIIKLEHDVGFLKFNIQDRGSQIQVLFNLDIKEHLIPADFYPALQALYGEYVTISKSKIVLSKI
ncbi:DUF3857 domain-containing protein [Rasiella rasia]|uniref:DUF3857 domain-containing protein n=1 Tax=Rasiella rasia TaxID=2744027 RepID=A0A6G6GP88_9FLAO|nr:transglutaminase domain-containing protein [Rasiella rasia]QIE60369.1 DUF3857 domain-containing protein [Rasiella rasia]